MRKLLLSLLILLIFISFTSAVAAVGKITVDPNTAKQESEEEKSFWEADERLAQKVNYEAERKTVLQILDDISEMTGVSLYAGYNSKDWQVRDRFMVILAQDLTLSELMQSMARVMKFKWSRSESEPYKYRLFMDRKTLLEEEGKAYRAELKYQRDQRQMREAVVDHFSKLANMSQEDAASLRENDPYSYALVKGGLAKHLNTLISECLELRNALVDGADYKSAAIKLSPNAQITAAKLIEIQRQLSGKPEQNDDVSELKISFMGAENEAFSVFPQHLKQGLVGMLLVKSGDGSFDLSIWDPKSIAGKVEDTLLARIIDNGSSEKDLSMEEYEAIFSAALQDVSEADNQPADFGEVKVRHEVDSALQVEVQLPPGENQRKEDKTRQYKTIYDLMLALAKGSEMSLVSDRLGSATQPLSKPDKVKLEAVLNDMQFSDNNWWKQGNVLEFRDRFWFKKRSMQIPQSYIDLWREKLIRENKLKLDTIAEMAVLVGDNLRYDTNIREDEVLHSDFMWHLLCWQNKSLLPYCCLSVQQRTASFSEEGLDLQNLTPEQRDIFCKYFSADDINGVLKIRSKSLPDDERCYYHAIIYMEEKPYKKHLFFIGSPLCKESGQKKLETLSVTNKSEK